MPSSKPRTVAFLWWNTQQDALRSFSSGHGWDDCLATTRGLLQLGGTLRVNTVLLFPGQGAQLPGMLHTLGKHPAVEETLHEISETLGCDIRTFDSPEELKLTVPVQLALLAAGVATARTLQQSGLEASAVAGLSVGAFSAAVAADAISLADAVTLVRSRAEQMEHLYPAGYGLAAIVGLNEKQ